jgi:anti-sigma B factor antagonist
VQSLLLQPQSVDPFVVLKASGELDIHTQEEFEREVSRLLGTASVVVDLSGLDFLAIAALRSLMVCHRQAGTAGHELFYADPSPQTLRLLTLSGLDAVLPVTASVAQVVGGSSAVGGVELVPLAGDRPIGGLVDQPRRDLAQLDIG